MLAQWLAHPRLYMKIAMCLAGLHAAFFAEIITDNTLRLPDHGLVLPHAETVLDSEHHIAPPNEPVLIAVCSTFAPEEDMNDASSDSCSRSWLCVLPDIWIRTRETHECKDYAPSGQ
ncbi:hypothetical protein BD414DRAFT_483109 [Trametes punicea]|nr:hypothetical protein BD414DRAFT_483109 [Trametes punicea]